ncbi:MAG: hypothetical protein WBW47_03285 [Thermoplasmata archaeon]
MNPPEGIPESVASAPTLTYDDRRWLHDKYERLAAEEGQLSSVRTSYYAAIGTVLITGLVVVLADLMNQASLLAVVVTFLAVLGILISIVWAVLLHRTNDAQNLWREAALRLEQAEPPVDGEWSVPITLRSGASLNLNLLRPFEAHAERFSRRRSISWMDRVNPSSLTEVLPLTFFVIWVAVLAIVWVWFLLLR